MILALAGLPDSDPDQTRQTGGAAARGQAAFFIRKT
eukprot:COSAG01_NODE_62976_length_282_cov_0.562842_1_plen_35_part_10